MDFKTISGLSYSEKLADKRWQDLRKKIIKRDGDKCRHCGAEYKPLSVHHIRYIGEPWECPKAMLITLCNDCHLLAEEMKVYRDYFYKIVMDRNISIPEVISLLNGLEYAEIVVEKQLFFNALEYFLKSEDYVRQMIDLYNSKDY